MPLTIASVAYPLSPVRPDAVGGAEQILRLIDRGLVDRGYRSIVVACEGSRVAGELVTTPLPAGRFDSAGHSRAVAHYRRTLDSVLSRWSVDLVHLHGYDFDEYLPGSDVPVLATVHLPAELAVARLFGIRRGNTWVHGVSRAQQRYLPQLPIVLPPIENGIALGELSRGLRRRSFALAFGRICPEKGFHLAIAAARRARTPLLLGGMVFPYEAHRRYFERELLPRLGGDCRFVGPLTLARKRRLLNAARCILLPSQVEETSSLAAMEALACGTPVVAFATGALPDIIEHGVTGYIVRDVDEMADAIARVGDIDPDACRQAARARFSADQMVDRYLRRYEWMLSRFRTRAPASATCGSTA